MECLLRQRLQRIAPVLLIFLAGIWWLYKPETADLSLSGDGCLVLAYHRVIPGPFPVARLLSTPDDYTLYLDDFRKQIRSLKAMGVHPIAPQELESIIKRRTLPSTKCLLVTLDDADISQYRYAFPILKEEHIPFVLFVITGQVGSSSFNGLEMSTWPQIREMVSSGLATVGSHTHNLHIVDSSKRPLFIRPEKTQEFFEDLQLSKATIQKETGFTPQYFAYPYGFGTPQTDQAALQLGMRLIFSLRSGIERPGDPSFFVKRVMVTSRNWKGIARWAQGSAPLKT